MEWKTFWKTLLFPPLWVLLVLTLLTAAGLVAVFSKDLSTTIPAYIIYAVAFYTLCIDTLFCIMVLPKQQKALRAKLHTYPLLHRYMTDPAFKTRVSLFLSLAVNLLYAGVNVLSWVLYRSMWFVVLAVYYAILSVMRFLLVRYIHRHPLGEDRLGELRRARLCSYILLLLNFVLTGAVMMILFVDKGFTYHGILIYFMAAYTFYITTHAIISLIKYRKYHSPVMTTSKIIALSAALVSMLALETAMFSQFGGNMARESQQLMIALTGAAVSAVVIALSVFMIVKGTREIKTLRQGKSENN